MGLNMEAVLSRLNHSGCRLCRGYDGTVAVNTVRFLTQDSKPYLKDALYVASMHDLQASLPIDKKINVICVGGRQGAKELESVQELNLVCAGGINIHDLFNRLNEILMDHAKNYNPSTMLLNALSEGKGLQHIVDVAFELLGNPILISDLSHKILAHTRKIDFGDPIWNELVSKGYRTYSLVLTGNSRGLFERIRRSGLPFIVPASGDPGDKSEFRYPKIYANISIADKTIGYISVVGVWKPFDINDIETVMLLSRVISQEMQKDRFFRNSRGMMLEYFISELMEEKITDSWAMEERMKYLNLEFKGNIYLMVIRAGKRLPENFIQNSLNRFDLENYGRTIIYNDDILMIAARNNEIINPEADLGGLVGLMSENGMYIGVSRCFRSLVNIREAYDQALKALEIGTLISCDKACHMYDEYAAYHFISSHQAVNLRKFCHPALKRLEEYDNKNETDYMRSLEAFLENDKKLIETSNILHVHRNTLSSRMERIEEIMKLDIRDPDITFHLLLSYKIIKTAKLLRNDKVKETREITEMTEEQDEE
jgi:sugar diacid utilization regulator